MASRMTYRPRWTDRDRPPFGMRPLWYASEEEGQAFFEEFVAAIPERVAMLECAVRSTKGFSRWRATFQRDTIEPLARWAVKVCERVPVEESVIIERIKETYGDQWPVFYKSPQTHKYYEHEWTPWTSFVCIDAGIYLGEAVRHSRPDKWVWRRYAKARTACNYNHPVLTLMGEYVMGGMWPVGIAANMFDPPQDPKPWTPPWFVEVFDNWCNRANIWGGSGPGTCPLTKRQERFLANREKELEKYRPQYSKG